MCIEVSHCSKRSGLIAEIGQTGEKEADNDQTAALLGRSALGGVQKAAEVNLGDIALVRKAGNATSDDRLLGRGVARQGGVYEHLSVVEGLIGTSWATCTLLWAYSISISEHLISSLLSLFTFNSPD